MDFDKLVTALKGSLSASNRAKEFFEGTQYQEAVDKANDDCYEKVDKIVLTTLKYLRFTQNTGAIDSTVDSVSSFIKGEDSKKQKALKVYGVVINELIPNQIKKSDGPTSSFVQPNAAFYTHDLEFAPLLETYEGVLGGVKEAKEALDGDSGKRFAESLRGEAEDSPESNLKKSANIFFSKVYDVLSNVRFKGSRELVALLISKGIPLDKIEYRSMDIGSVFDRMKKEKPEVIKEELLALYEDVEKALDQAIASIAEFSEVFRAEASSYLSAMSEAREALYELTKGGFGGVSLNDSQEIKKEMGIDE